MGAVGGWAGVRLGFVVFRGDTDQCCKVYQLHVIVTVVTAIVLILFVCFFLCPNNGGLGAGDAQNFILIYDFYIFSLYFFLFVFAKKKC